jgi:hypothetical protein
MIGVLLCAFQEARGSLYSTGLMMDTGLSRKLGELDQGQIEALLKSVGSEEKCAGKSIKIDPNCSDVGKDDICVNAHTHTGNESSLRFQLKSDFSQSTLDMTNCLKSASEFHEGLKVEEVLKDFCNGSQSHTLGDTLSEIGKVSLSCSDDWKVTLTENTLNVISEKEDFNENFEFVLEEEKKEVTVRNHFFKIAITFEVFDQDFVKQEICNGAQHMAIRQSILSKYLGKHKKENHKEFGNKQEIQTFLEDKIEGDNNVSEELKLKCKNSEKYLFQVKMNEESIAAKDSTLSFNVIELFAWDHEADAVKGNPIWKINAPVKTMFPQGVVERIFLIDVADLVNKACNV